MKTNRKIWKSALLGALALTGCQKDPQQVQDNFTGELIAVTAQTQEDGATRTTLNGFRTEWVTGDKIGVFSTQAGASNTPLTAASAGATSAFDGEMTWGTGTHDFYAYYPHVAGSFDYTAVPVSLPANQTQSSGGSTAHLGALDFMVAQPLTDVAPGGNVQFQFRHLFTLLEFRVLSSGEVSKIEIKASGNRMLSTSSSKTNISQADPTLNQVGYNWSPSVSLSLNTPATLTKNKDTTPALYMMIYMTNSDYFIGEELTITTTIDGQPKTITTDGFRMERGSKYVLVVDPDKGVTQPEPEDGVVINGVKWATRNIGERGTFAASPESYGNHYAFKDAQTACPPGWRIPTQAEFQNLVSSGSAWTTVNGVNGCRLGSGDNTIFFSAAGAIDPDGNAIAHGNRGLYWSSTPSGDSWYRLLSFDETEITATTSSTININYHYGYSLRCVEDRAVSVTGVTIFSTMTLQKGDTEIVTATVSPWNADNQSVTWSSSNTAVATINSITGEITAINEGTTTITATTVDGGFSDSGTLTVTLPTTSMSLLDSSVDPNSTLVEHTASPQQWQRLISGNYGFMDDMVEITNTVYSKFNDDFDFIFYVLNTPHNDAIISSLGFYGVNISVSKSVNGIGSSIYSNASYWGSAGKLQSVMYLPYDRAIVNGPALHELAHNWAAYIVPTYDWDNSRFDGHWGLSNAGGQLGGFTEAVVREENSGGVQGKTLYQARYLPKEHQSGYYYPYGNFGTYANGGNGLPYSDIELYLMGMKSAQELRDEDFTLDIYSGNSYSLDAPYSTNDGYFWSTTKTSYTIDDIIQKNGARVPDTASSQKSFKLLTVVLTQEGQTQNNYAEIIKGISWFSGGMSDKTYGQHLYNFQQATYGRGTLVTSGVKNSLKPQTRSGAIRTAPLVVPSLPDDYRDWIHIDRADDKLLAPER